MDITDIVSTEFVSFDQDTPVSQVRGAFEDPDVKAVLVTADGDIAGVVTRRQLAVSHRHPGQRLESIVWTVPRVSPDEDVREVARLMRDSSSRVLPVYEGRQHRGVVTADDLLQAVQPFLEAATVADAYSQELLTADPETTLGEALHVLREHAITHLPVLQDDSLRGMLSLHDVIPATARATDQPQGGHPGGTVQSERSHGGFGAREGELDRLLDLPVRDLMVSPVRTIRPRATVEEAVAEMFDVGGSALVVVEGDGRPVGILTKSDVLEALTWGAEGNRAVQLYGADLLDDITYDEVVAMVDTFDEMNGDLAVIDAKVHLHEHDETLRGSSLILARIRLGTDRGLFMAEGEGYGARHAIDEARDVLERRLRDEKTRGRSKKHPDEAFWEKRFGWWLEA